MSFNEARRAAFFQEYIRHASNTELTSHVNEIGGVSEAEIHLALISRPICIFNFQRYCEVFSKILYRFHDRMSNSDRVFFFGRYRALYFVLLEMGVIDFSDSFEFVNMITMLGEIDNKNVDLINIKEGFRRLKKRKIHETEDDTIFCPQVGIFDLSGSLCIKKSQYNSLINLDYAKGVFDELDDEWKSLIVGIHDDPDLFERFSPVNNMKHIVRYMTCLSSRSHFPEHKQFSLLMSMICFNVSYFEKYKSEVGLNLNEVDEGLGEIISFLDKNILFDFEHILFNDYVNALDSRITKLYFDDTVNGDTINFSVSDKMISRIPVSAMRCFSRYIERLSNESKRPSLRRCFSGCKFLRRLDIPSNFNTKFVDITGIFDGCSINEFNYDKKKTDDVFNLIRLLPRNLNLYGGSESTSKIRSYFNIKEVEAKKFISVNFKAKPVKESLSALSSLNTWDIVSYREFLSDISDLQGFSFPEGIHTLNVDDTSFMFSRCSSLSSIDLSSFNTSNVTNMYGMFNGCSSLTSLDLSTFNTGNVVNMSYMFHNCHKLTALNLSNFDTKSCIDMKNMFSGCSNLSSLDISAFDTCNVLDMSYMFNGCSGLSALILPRPTMSNVRNMAFIFSNCLGLTELDLSNFDTSNVEDMEGMFYGCTSLDKLDLSKFNTSNVTKMSYMFFECSRLSALDLSMFNATKVANIECMFSTCTELANIELPEFKSSKITMMHKLFNNCSKLVRIDMSKFDTSNVDDTSYMFNMCRELEYLDFTGCCFDKLVNVEGMFALCKKLKSVNGLKIKGGITSTYRFFSGCTSLVDFELSNRNELNTHDVTDMSLMFDECSKLTELDFPCDMTSVKKMNSMFSKCVSLTSVKLSGDGGLSMVEDLGFMFFGCSSLQSVEISDKRQSSSQITDMSYMFARCEKLINFDSTGLVISDKANLKGINQGSNVKFTGTLEKLNSLSRDSGSECII